MDAPDSGRSHEGTDAAEAARREAYREEFRQMLKEIAEGPPIDLPRFRNRDNHPIGMTDDGTPQKPLTPERLARIEAVRRQAREEKAAWLRREEERRQREQAGAGRREQTEAEAEQNPRTDLGKVSDRFGAPLGVNDDGIPQAPLAEKEQAHLEEMRRRAREEHDEVVRRAWYRLHGGQADGTTPPPPTN